MASLGNRLQQARLQQSLTEEQVSQDTCISLANIRSLESDDYTNFASPVYAKSFIKTYSSYLNLDVSEILVKFDELRSGDETVFEKNCSKLKDTERPAETIKSRSPLILAPVLVIIALFLCISLFSILTGRQLPFGPGGGDDTTAGEPSKPAAAKIPVISVDKDKEEPTEIIPVRISEDSDQAADGGPYVDDFHAANGTTYLRVGSPNTVVLP